MGELIDTLSAVPSPEDLQALDADGILAIDTKKQAKMEELYAPLKEYFAEGAFEQFIPQALLYEYRKQCYELKAMDSRRRKEQARCRHSGKNPLPGCRRPYKNRARIQQARSRGQDRSCNDGS